VLGLGLAAGSKEREPVPLLPAFTQVLGAPDSARYKLFESHVLSGFCILRRYLATLSNVVEIIVGGQGISPDAVKDSLAALGAHLFTDLSEDEAVQKFRKLLQADKAHFTQCYAPNSYPAPPMSDGWLW
jgi:hypothetical protein